MTLEHPGLVDPSKVVQIQTANSGHNETRLVKEMKNLFIIGAAIYSLSLVAPPALARVGEEYIRWTRGEFDMPAKIKDANNVSELEPFLNSNREFTRMAAVTRLGEIQGRKGVDLLLEMFTKEPSVKGLDIFPLVRLEIIRTLGRVRGDEAKSALLSITKTFWSRGPQCACKRCKGKGLYPWHDRDYQIVLSAALKTLQKWDHDKKVLSLAKQIALDEKLRSTPVRVKAWELYLITNIANKGITTKVDSLAYLINFLEETGVQPETYVVKDKVGMRTLKSIKTDAVRNILKGYSQTALSYLQNEIQETPGSDKNRLEALSYAIAQVKESLKHSAEQKSKNRSK